MSSEASSEASSNYPRDFQLERTDTSVAAILHQGEFTPEAAAEAAEEPAEPAAEDNNVEEEERQEDLDMEWKARKNAMVAVALATGIGYHGLSGLPVLARVIKGAIFGLACGGFTYVRVKLYQNNTNLSPQEKALLRRVPGVFKNAAPLTEIAAGLGNHRACANQMGHLSDLGLIKRQGGSRDATYKRKMKAFFYW
jgi:hypothetical protein